MIKRLEKRFTIVAISVISLVLLLLLFGINFITIRENINGADAALEKTSLEVYDFDHGVGLDIFRDEPIKPPRDDNRTFSVIVDDKLNLISTNSLDKNIMSTSDSYSYAKNALDSNKTSGFIDNYRYLVVESNNQTRVIFLDYSFEKDAENNFLVISAIFYLISVILVGILVKVFMRPVMRPIKEADTKQKQFITDASHELKTPLTIISTDIQVIELESGKSEWTKSINNQVERLKTLSNDLVTLSRMEENDKRFEMTSVNFSDILNDVLIGFEPAIKSGNREFTTNIEGNIEVLGNPDALEQVLSLLMHNALKYSTKEGFINVNLSKKGKGLVLTIENSVEGLDIGEHPEFFERFYRADKSRNSETGGFGIGLAVAKSIIKEHGGKIKAEVTEDENFIITITIN